VPGVLGAGYESIDSALHNQFGWQLLLVLGLAKMAAALVCYSAGVPGGMFAPALFIGAMIGGSLGAGAQLVWPVPTSPVGAYVLVGMGTFFVGTFRAPMTSIFMIFEISASYQIILPVMVANTIAYLTSRYLQPVPFFDRLALIEGLALPSHEGQRETQAIRIEDQMRPRVPPPIYLADTANHACNILTRSAETVGLVRNELNQWMILRVAVLEEAIGRGEGSLLVSQLVDPDPTPVLYPDLAVHEALRIIKNFPCVPVVSRRDPSKLVGTFSVADGLRAYGIPPSITGLR
jgi:CIC family chloride channel protein